MSTCVCFQAGLICSVWFTCLLVASFAASSACSFPDVLTCALTQPTVSSWLVYAKISNCSKASQTIFLLIVGLLKATIAACESESSLTYLNL